MILLPLLAAALASTGAAAPVMEADVRAAIVAAVQERMGRAADVSIERLTLRVMRPARRVVAAPDAGSRVGGPIRFVLIQPEENGAPAARIGSADAVVHVTQPHLRTTRRIERRAVLAAGDVVAASADVGRVALRLLPDAQAAVGAAVRRDLPADAAVTAADIVPVPLVRSGAEVTTVARVGAVEVRSRATAASDAGAGETVRLVVNRRTLRGRVTAAGEVEVRP